MSQSSTTQAWKGHPITFVKFHVLERSHLVQLTFSRRRLQKGVDFRGYPGGSAVKNPPTMQEAQVPPLGQEDPLEEEMATHSNILAWKIPWTKEPGMVETMGSQSRTRQNDWAHFLISEGRDPWVSFWEALTDITQFQLLSLCLTHLCKCLCMPHPDKCWHRVITSIQLPLAPLAFPALSQGLVHDPSNCSCL